MRIFVVATFFFVYQQCVYGSMNQLIIRKNKLHSESILYEKLTRITAISV